MTCVRPKWTPRILIFAGVLAACLVGVNCPASAAGVCTVGNGALAFGVLFDLTPTTTLDGSGSFSVNCVGSGVAYTVALDKGTFGASISSRSMQLAGGSALLAYQIYQDSAHTVIFGDGVIGSTESGSLPLGGVATVNVFGRIPSQTAIVVGAYTDSVTVTLTF